MVHISLIMERSNNNVLQEVQPKTRLLCLGQSQILSSFGHKAKIYRDCLKKFIMQRRVEGSKKPGRSRTRWIDKKNPWPDHALFKIFILLPRIVRDGVPFLTSRAVSHDGIKPTNKEARNVLET